MKRVALYLILVISMISMSGCFLFEPLPPEGYSSVTVTGIVYDIHHDPVSGAKVWIHQGTGAVSDIYYTNANGEYIIDGVLVQTDWEFLLKSTSTGYTTESHSEPRSMEVVSKYATKACTVWISKIGDNAFVTCKGKAINSESLPVKNMAMTAYYKVGDTSTSLLVRTDDNGEYIFENFLVRPMSTMSCVAHFTDGSPVWSDNYLIPYDMTLTIDYLLERYKIMVSFKGKVVNTDGKPLQGASMHFQGYNVVPVSYTLTTDSNGEFVLNGLQIEYKSTLIISASAPGYSTSSIVLNPNATSTYQLDDFILNAQ